MVKREQRKFTLAETFVGVGGSHLGFKLAGFKTVYVNDYDPDMIKAFKDNNPKLPEEIIDDRPIEKVKANDILKITKLKKGQLDVLFGGTVCKGFSLAGVRDPSDPRNTLYKQQLRLVRKIMPKISILENVPGMKNFLILKNGANKKLKERVRHVHQRLEDFKGIKAERRKKHKGLTQSEKKEYEKIKKEKGELIKPVKENSINVIDDLRKRYKKLGYNLEVMPLNAAWYGAATTRTRLIMVALRKDLGLRFSFPKIKYLNGGGPRKGIIKKIKNGVPKSLLGERLKKFKAVKDALAGLDLKHKNNHEKDKQNVPMQHNSKTARRFRLIPQGKNIVNVMHKVPRELKISRYYSRGCTMRLDPNKPAPTLVPGHSNFPVHPDEDRSITVREASTISGFPIDYIFHGNHTKRCSQVGNAVPPPLAKAIALEVKEILKKHYKK